MIRSVGVRLVSPAKRSDAAISPTEGGTPVRNKRSMARITFQ
jgi:hypothetical protein